MSLTKRKAARLRRRAEERRESGIRYQAFDVGYRDQTGYLSAAAVTGLIERVGSFDREAFLRGMQARLDRFSLVWGRPGERFVVDEE